jgi:hypothetical protein
MLPEDELGCTPENGWFGGVSSLSLVASVVESELACCGWIINNEELGI